MNVLKTSRPSFAYPRFVHSILLWAASKMLRNAVQSSNVYMMILLTTVLCCFPFLLSFLLCLSHILLLAVTSYHLFCWLWLCVSLPWAQNDFFLYTLRFCSVLWSSNEGKGDGQNWSKLTLHIFYCQTYCVFLSMCWLTSNYFLLHGVPLLKFMTIYTKAWHE